MAKDKKLVKNITSRDEDFAQWYTDVVREAQLCDYSSVKGCLNYLPNGFAIWELIKADLDRRFKETGVENVYLPCLIPETLLEKEADHIEGFAPEVAWVTHGGMERLQERFCVRPTSETLFCDVWSKTVQSYRDLPKVWNQWCSVLRWEKTTRPFLRSREFLWQEGHTIHATYEEAEEGPAAEQGRGGHRVCRRLLPRRGGGAEALRGRPHQLFCGRREIRHPLPGLRRGRQAAGRPAEGKGHCCG